MKVKVSVIIPVWNVEKYIAKCLDSLLNQTLKEIEIIVVNDGSPDNSQKIIDKYVKKYPNKVKSFIKENGGRADVNTLLIRCLIPYGILVNFILIILILFVSKSLFLNISNILSNLHMIIIFITLIFMMIKSRGLHDYLAKTKIVEI